MKKERELAIKIISIFEDYLADNNVKIKNTEKEGNDGESIIYGTDYYNLEDTITEILENKNK